MAVITVNLIRVINPGQHHSTCSKSAVNASLLVGTNKQKVTAGLQKGHGWKICPVFSRKPDSTDNGVSRGSTTKDPVLDCYKHKDQEIGWPKKGLLKAARIAVRYFCGHSFATCDALLSSQELATKLVGNSSITSKYYRLQSE